MGYCGPEIFHISGPFLIIQMQKWQIICNQWRLKRATKTIDIRIGTEVITALWGVLCW
jgi:hypothetical protein